MTLFFTTLVLTIPLFIGAALLINFCRRRAGGRTSASSSSGTCQPGGHSGCGCAAAVQQRIDRLPR
ncbi:hypothetical protein [Desulfofustis limnaeus]|jgi:hypothetical protein|uniref:Uncharacterized protein n=1 Tax=Desulfofustis limnaeus TaxID=2740163 RepID=A0ABM7WC22_9BACT|nr:hypothetical protein [Desulfofustis limnaeus]MDX9895226.1 hypothetical protein [Desulfofustis sp.]BDD88515.1 hypothetical protein DPPLL_28800 [Desulfofustis limnaeus]